MTALVAPVMISLAHNLAYPALVVPQLRNDNGTLHLDLDDGSWYTSMNSVSSPLGSLMAGIVIHVLCSEKKAFHLAVFVSK